MTLPLHERTIAIQRSLQTRERAPLAHFDSRRYIQHNLGLGDGLGPILELMDSLPADATRVTAVRAFTDGDHSVAHLEYHLGDWGPMVGFEVHRWEDDRIVEHWDNLQPTPATANPAGRTMTDGEVSVADPDKTDDHKRLVEDFTIAVLIDRQHARGHDFLHPDLIQHDPALHDGADALLRAHEAGDQPRYVRMHKVLGSGSFVLVMSEGVRAGADGADEAVAIYDLWRVADDRLAERWVVTETIPERAAWKNDNGKF
jgi:predicted SnoaL-like aldol condensation-catalyzing enzyme